MGREDTKPEAILQAKDEKVVGTLAVRIPGGVSRKERDRTIDEALGAALSRACDSLGVVLAAKPASYTKERPGRDEQGRTVLEVLGKVEGDVLVPAVRPPAA